MIKVIINADDLGKSPEVNREIGRALKDGAITSSTILANSQYWEEIHEIVDSNPQASFGVNLNLTEGEALTNSNVFLKYQIVDNSNKFTRKIFEFLDVEKLQDDLSDAIYNEWDRQIGKVVNVERVSITHVDGHHHIHHYYALSSILLRLVNKYNIKICRRRYAYPTNRRTKLVVNMVRKLATEINYLNLIKIGNIGNIGNGNKYYSLINSNMAVSLWMRRFDKLCVTDYFDSYRHFVSQVTKGNQISKDSVIELMCHPGHEMYADEMSLIRSNTLQRLISDVAVVSYKDWDSCIY